jgi:predicted O-methyltransferase YrrM
LGSGWFSTWRLLQTVEGHLTHDEAQWLYLTAATCPALGQIVEIGSFKGKSAIALAKGVCVSQTPAKVIAIDPHSSPSTTDPGLNGTPSSEPEMRANLALAGVSDVVDVRVQLSTAAAAQWSGPVRLLWVDGDHTLRGVSADLDSWLPHLSEGGVLAMHDVLHGFDGPSQAFLDRVLEMPGWANIGFVKSIGFATRASRTDLTSAPRTKRQVVLLKRAIALSRAPGAFRRLAYKLCRWVLHRL